MDTQQIQKLLSLAFIFQKHAKKKDKEDESKDKKKKGKGLKPAADAIMEGKSHPFTDCVKKFKEQKKVESPEGLCAKMKDLHKGTTEWRSTEGLKNKKKKDKKKD